MPRNTAANRTSWLVEFGVLLSEDEATQGRVLALFLERGFVSGFLLIGEGFDCLNDLRELVVYRNLSGRVRVFVEVSRFADFSRAKGFATFLEIGVRMGTDFSSVVVHHVNGFVLCHS